MENSLEGRRSSLPESRIKIWPNGHQGEGPRDVFSHAPTPLRRRTRSGRPMGPCRDGAVPFGPLQGCSFSPSASFIASSPRGWGLPFLVAFLLGVKPLPALPAGTLSFRLVLLDCGGYHRFLSCAKTKESGGQHRSPKTGPSFFP